MRAILALGLPLAGVQLAQFALHLTDTVMLGWHDVTELAAAVLAGSYWFTIFIVGSGFGIAVMPLVATAVARDDEREVRRTTRMAVWLSLAFGVVVMPLMLFAGPILTRLGQKPEVVELASVYLLIEGWAIFPALLIGVLKSYFAAQERTQFVLWSTVAAVFVNAAINYLLIFGHFGAPELGIRGAAIASITVNLLSLAALVAYAAAVWPEHALFARFWRPDWAGMKAVFRLGWPIGLTNLAEVGLFTGAAVMIGWIDTLTLAAHGIALQIASVTFLVHMGLSNAATVRAGRALGRGDESELRRGGVVAIAVSGGFALVAVACFVLFPQQLVGLFIDPADPVRPQVLAIGTTLLLYAAAFQVADAGQVMALGLLRGVQDTKVPMIMAAVSYWGVAIPASYALGFGLGLGARGVWAGLVVGLAAAWVTMSVRFWLGSVRISARGA